MACSYTALWHLQVMASAAGSHARRLVGAVHRCARSCVRVGGGYERRAENVLAVERGACRVSEQARLAATNYPRGRNCAVAAVRGEGGPGVVSRAGRDPASRTR